MRIIIRMICALSCLAVSSHGSAQAELTSAARIAMLQYEANQQFGNWQLNIEKLTAMALDAVNAGAKMVILPEGATNGYATPTEAWCTTGRSRCGKWQCRDVQIVGENLPSGRTTAHWMTFAQQHAVYVVYPVIEVDAERYYNAIGVVGPDGFITKYRKRVLYGPDYCYAEPGKRPAHFTTPFGKFGLMICADGNADSYYRTYRQQNVDAVIITMDWDQDPLSQRAAKHFFQEKAGLHSIPIFAADNAKWDGTGHYPSDGTERIRDGLDADAIGEEGIVFSESTP